MTVYEGVTILPFRLNGEVRHPEIHESATLLPGSFVSGAVSIAEGVSLWPSASVRGDSDEISIGAGSNVQDNCSLHADPGSPCRVGSGVSIGHNAVVHGCTVEDDVLIGMSATVMNGAVVGTGSLVAAGALITEGTVIPPNSLVAGVPGKVRRETTEEERESIRQNALRYRERPADYEV